MDTDIGNAGEPLGFDPSRKSLAELVEPLLRYHESGGHEGDGSDAQIALIRAALTPGETTLERSPAQFFFEVGYGACWAEAYLRQSETPPFPLTDQIIEHAWDIAGEAHEDPAEFDLYLAAANSTPSPATPEQR